MSPTRVTVISILFFLTLSPVFARDSLDFNFQITREDCIGGLPDGSVDLSHHFTRTKDQGNLPYCTGYTASALLEEMACEQSKTSCGESLSALDAVGCEWEKMGVGIPQFDGRLGDGIRVDVLMGCLKRQGGLCPSRFAALPESGWTCAFSDYTSSKDDNNYECILSRIMERYDEACSALLNLKNSASCKQCEQSYGARYEKEMTKLYTYVMDVLSKQSNLDPAEFDHALESSCIPGQLIDKNRFIKSILITQKCTQNRVQVFSNDPKQSEQLQSFIPEKQATYQENPKARQPLSEQRLMLDFLKQGFKEGRSTAVALCSRNIGFKKCGNHALVASGIRWDSKKGCQLLLRNSWGEDNTVLHGWQNIEPSIEPRTVLDRINELHRYSRNKDSLKK